MSKADKKEQKIRKNPNNVSLEDFEFLITQYGRILTGGGHPKAYINGRVFPYKRHNPMSTYYIEAVLRIIDEMKGE